MEVYLDISYIAVLEELEIQSSVRKKAHEQQSRTQEAANRSLEEMLRIFQDASASERGSWAEDREVITLSQMTPPSSYQKEHTHRNELSNKCLTLQIVHQLIGIPQPVSEVLEPLEPNGKPNKAMRMIFPENKLPGNLGQFIESQGEEWACKMNKWLNDLILAPEIVRKSVRIDSATIFFHATRSGIVEIVQFLCAAGFNPNIVNQFDKTPLLIAVINDDIPMVNALLDFGACITSAASHGPLAYAVNSRNYKDSNMFNIILNSIRKTNTKIGIRDGEAALRMSILRKYEDFVKALLEAGVNPNNAEDGFTLLWHATRHGASLEIVKTLLQFGAKPNASDLRYAENSGDPELVQIFQSYMKT